MKKSVRYAWCFGTKYKVMTAKIHDVLAGAMSGNEKVIYINEKDNKKDQIHTAIHELYHAMSKEISFNQTIPPELEEILADNVATLMTKNFNIRWKK